MNSDIVETIAISDEELKSLTDAIQKRHGIDFSCYEPKSLKRRVVRVLHIFKLSAVHELWIKILKDHAFIFPFMDEISVGLTAMFRDPVLWKRIRRILKEDFKDRSDLSIWHAGSSSGEEVYTMGIVLKEAGHNKLVTARATDISKQAMETAKSGEYHKMKLKDYEQNYKEYNPAGALTAYCKEDGEVVKFNTTLISHVKFDYHNLITDSFIGKYDIIFCRNVMIYFDNGAKRKLFEKFHQSLTKNGLLIIGFYDAVLPLVDEKKFKIYDLDAKIFQKIEEY
ncbi:MAG: protein-glutamate O-methyltransferase CheR [Chryseolinea sp.]